MPKESWDSHIVERVVEIRDLASGKWRDVMPRMEAALDGDYVVVDGYGLLGLREISPSISRIDDVPAAATDAKSRKAYQRVSGLGWEMLFPTIGLFVLQHPDAGYRTEYARAYNEWLGEAWGGRPEFGLVGILGDIDDISNVVELSVAKGFDGVLLPSSPWEGAWSDPGYLKIFASLAEAQLLACFHAFTVPPARMSRRVSALVTASRESEDVFLELTVGGTLECVPGLRIVIAEGAYGWLRDIETFIQVQDRWASSEILSRVSLVHGERIRLPRPLRAVKVRWGSDYPHGAGGS